ncbi:MAG TPA: nucleotidyltransferase domain-containing protein [Acidimicrobiales bacterium]|nr:nucleotidyltransferase domain-containing protein [Acidimicrobiales bacterium]
MPEGPAVAEVLAAHVRERYPDDVDLVAYYGSWARGTATAESDIDIFYVPAEGRDPPLAQSLLVGGRLVDFWPLPWPKLRGFADGTARGWAFAPAVVADARPVYARSDEAVDHLDRLKALVIELQQAAAAPRMLERAVGQYGDLVRQLAQLTRFGRASVVGARAHALAVLASAWECLALANQVYFDERLAKSIRRVDRFRSRPDDLETCVASLLHASTTDQVLVAAETLVADVGDVLRVLEGTRQAPPTPGPAAIGRVYPELHDAVRKVVDACARGDVVRATVEAWLLQRDVDATLLGGDTGSAGDLRCAHVDAGPVRAALGLVDLLAIPARALADLANAARDIDAQLLAAAREGGPPRLETLDDLRAHLRVRIAGDTRG